MVQQNSTGNKISTASPQNRSAQDNSNKSKFCCHRKQENSPKRCCCHRKTPKNKHPNSPKNILQKPVTEAKNCCSRKKLMLLYAILPAKIQKPYRMHRIPLPHPQIHIFQTPLVNIFILRNIETIVRT